MQKLWLFIWLHGAGVESGQENNTVLAKIEVPWIVIVVVVIQNEKNTFRYLGCFISYQDEKDIRVSVSEFFSMTRIFNRKLKPSQVQKHTRQTTNNTLALPTLLYRCELGPS